MPVFQLDERLVRAVHITNRHYAFNAVPPVLRARAARNKQTDDNQSTQHTVAPELIIVHVNLHLTGGGGSDGTL